MTWSHYDLRALYHAYTGLDSGDLHSTGVEADHLARGALGADPEAAGSTDPAAAADIDPGPAAEAGLEVPAEAGLEDSAELGPEAPVALYPYTLLMHV